MCSASLLASRRRDYYRRREDREAWASGFSRAALELGSYHRKFFISHNPEAWALADVVLEMAGLGGGLMR
ncbi:MULTISPECIES: hypothetical protein [Thiorhodovibrio]|uniref:hypothetical protein n=1 Tax=Thiorhodovibrio TaxID=61593 RepID=UPI001913BB8D|nr:MULTISPECIES: hypothetical protein [Thiorhodovibrio]